MNITTILVIFLLIFQDANLYGAEEVSMPFHGSWRTAPYISQMGRVVTKYTFNKNGECTASMLFLDAKLDEVKEKGFCEFKNGKITMRNRNGVFVNTYTLLNDILTITEKNGDTYKLEREL